jgi:hypothetical protein
MLKSITVISLAVLCLTVCVQAENAAQPDIFAATVATTDGKVLVNSGQGFVATLPQNALAIGDQIMVGGESQAVLVYGKAGCRLTLNANTLLRITAKPPCKPGEHLAMDNQVFVQPAAFDGTFTDNSGPRLLALGGVFTVGALVAVVALSYQKPAAAVSP